METNFRLLNPISNESTSTLTSERKNDTNLYAHKLILGNVSTAVRQLHGGRHVLLHTTAYIWWAHLVDSRHHYRLNIQLNRQVHFGRIYRNWEEFSKCFWHKKYTDFAYKYSNVSSSFGAKLIACRWSFFSTAMICLADFSSFFKIDFITFSYAFLNSFLSGRSDPKLEYYCELHDNHTNHFHLVRTFWSLNIF